MNYFNLCTKIIINIMIVDNNSFYSIAPMMGKTDSFFCYLMKIINNKTFVYTEMMHAETIIRTNILDNYKMVGDLSNIAVQIAGNSPTSLAKAAKKAEKYGFSEINLNCGCPSKNVVAGDFGITLLLNPNLVQECVLSMKEAVKSEISVKTRIGINYEDNEQLLDDFIGIINTTGIKKYVIHARNGVLGNMTTKKNLTIPILKYERVYKLKKKFSDNNIIINGGFLEANNYEVFYKKIDGIMIGREAYKNPWIFFNAKELSLKIKIAIILQYLEYLKKIFNYKKFNNNALYHIQNIFNGHDGAKNWRKKVNYAIHNNDLQSLFNFIECDNLS